MTCPVRHSIHAHRYNAEPQVFLPISGHAPPRTPLHRKLCMIKKGGKRPFAVGAKSLLNFVKVDIRATDALTLTWNFRSVFGFVVKRVYYLKPQMWRQGQTVVSASHQ